MAGYKTLGYLSAIVVLGVIVESAGGPASAATWTWDPNKTLSDSSGTWDTASSLWYTNPSDSAWSNAAGSVAAFGWGTTGSSTTPYTVTLGTNIAAAGLIFNNQNYTIAPDAGNQYGLTIGGSGIAANVSATVSAPSRSAPPRRGPSPAARR